MTGYTNTKLKGGYITLLEQLGFSFFLVIYIFKILEKDVLLSNVKLTKRNTEEKNKY